MRFGVIRLVHPLDAPCQLLDELHRRAMGSGELARHHLFEGIGGPNAFREIQTRFERTGIERELDAVAACVRRGLNPYLHRRGLRAATRPPATAIMVPSTGRVAS